MVSARAYWTHVLLERVGGKTTKVQRTAAAISGQVISLHQEIERRSAPGVRVVAQAIIKQAQEAIKLAQAGAWDMFPAHVTMGEAVLCEKAFTNEMIVSFLKSVRKGTWWTRLAPNPQEPTWGAKYVYVSTGPDKLDGHYISVGREPGSGRVRFKIGASDAEVQATADKLLASA